MAPDGGRVNFTVNPGPAEGTMLVPGSKSITHRAFLLAAQSTTPCEVHGALRGGDTLATLRALQRFGANVEDGETQKFIPSSLCAADVNLENAGTGLRLLTGLAARFEGKSTFDGDASLRQRPNHALIQALREAGAVITSDERIPYTVSGPIRAGAYMLPPSVSSQYGSALLLNLPFLDGDSSLTMAKPVASAPYLEITKRTAYAFGLEMAQEDNVFHIPGNQSVAASHFQVEGDWSAAAFPLVAGAIAGKVTAQGVVPDSTQGDERIARIIADFGAKVTQTNTGCTVEHAPLTSPGTIDVSQIPDTFPALCILAANAKGTTTFVGGKALRHKESDRIQAMAHGLTKLGITCQETPEGLVIEGGEVQGGRVMGHDDHRIHMAFAVAGLTATSAVTITDAESAAISYPNFHEQFQVIT